MGSEGGQREAFHLLIHSLNPRSLELHPGLLHGEAGTQVLGQLLSSQVHEQEVHQLFFFASN